MKVGQILPRIYNVIIADPRQLAETFMRFQEHAESPVFKDRTFSRKEFAEWYTANSPKGMETGKFTYHDDWVGFNVPSSALQPFYEGRFNPLQPQEGALLHRFAKIRGTKFYAIGTHEQQRPGSLKHEIAHGLLFTEDGYRKEALDIVAALSPQDSGRIKKFLGESGGYHPDVWADEMHAYVLAGLWILKRDGVEVSPGIEEASRLLNQLYENHFSRLSR